MQSHCRRLSLVVLLLLTLVLPGCGEIPQPGAPQIPAAPTPGSAAPTPTTVAPNIPQASPSPPERKELTPLPTLPAESGLQTLIFFASDGTHRVDVDAQSLALSGPTIVAGYAVSPSPGGIASVSPSPDGRYLALKIGGEVIDSEAFDLALRQKSTFHLMGRPAGPLRYMSWTSQGDLLAASIQTGTGLWRLNVREDKDHFFFGVDTCPECYTSAAASPDGKTIVYSRAESSIGFGSKVWKMNADGTGAELLLVDQDNIVGGLSFSPDGTRLAYATIPDTAGTYSYGKVWTMNPDGTDQRLLSEEADGGRGYIPYWSPDGRYLAFTSREGLDPDYNNIHLVDTQSGEERDLLPLKGKHNYDPCWSPDGSRLVFVSDSGGADEIWAINVDGSGLQQLTKDGQYKRFPLWIRARWDSSLLPFVESYLAAGEKSLTRAD